MKMLKLEDETPKNGDVCWIVINERMMELLRREKGDNVLIGEFVNREHLGQMYFIVTGSINIFQDDIIGWYKIEKPTFISKERALAIEYAIKSFVGFFLTVFALLSSIVLTDPIEATIIRIVIFIMLAETSYNVGAGRGMYKMKQIMKEED